MIRSNREQSGSLSCVAAAAEPHFKETTATTKGSKNLTGVSQISLARNHGTKQWLELQVWGREVSVGGLMSLLQGHYLGWHFQEHQGFFWTTSFFSSSFISLLKVSRQRLGTEFQPCFPLHCPYSHCYSVLVWLRFLKGHLS